MKIFVTTAEYNPFHNGHQYHVRQMRQMGADAVVAVMSGNFVQRGQPACADKFERAAAAVRRDVYKRQGSIRIPINSSPDTISARV